MKPNEISGPKSYLEFRANWKAQYLSLSEDIRKQKALRGKNSDEERSLAQSRCAYLQVQARNEMKQLDEAKAKRPIRNPEQAAA